MSATKAGKRPLRSLTAHEKLSAIKRVSVGGESKASVARDIGVPESTLRGWCKNQEKISYQVRTSPSNLEDAAPENLNLIPAKRIKLEDQPYNLSMKTSDVSNGSYSPNSESNFEGEYPKSSEAESETSPLNLRTIKVEPTPILAASTPKTTNNNFEKEKEREKNRAELARLSAELGLNRPEVLMSTLNNTSNLTDLTTALLQWKSVYQTWFYQQQQKAALHQGKSNIGVTSPIENGTKLCSPTNNGLLTTIDKRDKMLNNIEQQPSVYDSVSYWLRQQSLLSLNNNTQQSVLSNLPNTSTITSNTNTITDSNNLTSQQNLALWNWYQQSAYNAAQMQSNARVASTAPQQPISPQQTLYQQLTKEPSSEKEVVSNCENIASETTKDEKPKNNNKSRSVLDNLLLNNNTIQCGIKKEDGDSLDAHEAIEHGEKFLNWLEHCSDPSVTTLQLHTVQSLIKNLKNAFDRKDCQIRNKVKRK
ncbi:unnamed protein product [Ceutorhynchus assimilis]|uniref:HTH psq-type domain-containing protein n=1 Tax=Ceutorhynchus assimilis TaxID=467358 RepID=A0A9N9QCM8_9CUCU|nr:unnamed protein product [Ceutorhynchus assimilis]